MQFNYMNHPFHGFNNYTPLGDCNRQIIGEGDVTSLVHPDGTVQYIFMPISQWWPQMCNNSMNNNYVNPMWNPNVAAWLVRSITNPQPQPVFCQLRSRPSGAPFQKQLYDLNFSKSDTTFKLKFHNDGWTSTTDLVYFYPSLRSHHQFTGFQYKGSAAIQVDLPPLTICHCEKVQNRHCLSAQKVLNKSGFESCEHPNAAVTRMSIDNICFKHESDTDVAPTKSSKKHKATKKKSKKNITCQCSANTQKPRTENKLVTTFADQASHCCEPNERLTQTHKSTSSVKIQKDSKDDINSDEWLPRLTVNKTSVKSTASNTSLDSSCPSDCSCRQMERNNETL